MNNRNQNPNHQRKYDPGMYPTNSTNQFSHSVSSPQNTAFLLGHTPRPQRHYVNPSHSVGEMKNNHLPNMSHGPIQQMHLPPRQTLYLPGGIPYQTASSPFYPFSPQQASSIIVPSFNHGNIQNFTSTQPGLYYTAPPRQIQITNLPQGPQNPPVANMSNAQNSHGTSLIVQSQPMEMSTNTQPLQVQPQPSTTPMQIPAETRPPRRKNAAVKIINPITGNEVVLDNINTQQSLPSADELEKMKVQSQFQTQVQSAVKKEDVKVSDIQNNEGKKKIINEFQSQIKKSLCEPTVTVTTEAIEMDNAQISEETNNKTEEIIVTTDKDEVLVENIDTTSTIGLTVNAEEVNDIIESDKEPPSTNTLPCSTPTLEIQSQSTDVSNISEDTSLSKKIIDEESLKPVKNKKSKKNKKKNLTKDNEEVVNNEQPSIIETAESVASTVTNTQENKENEIENHNSKNEEEESIVQKLEDVSQPQETQNNGIQQETVENITPKMPSYLDNLPYAEGQWSVTNPTGKKVYSKSFLIQLGSESVCQKKPDVLKSWNNITKLSNSPQFGSLGGMIPNLPRSQSASATGFMPSYFKLGNNSQRGMPVMPPGAKRNSSQGKTASKNAKPNTIHMSLSLREEVKLNQTENAWVPTAKKGTKVDVAKDKNEEELKTEDVNKNVRSILNKITPENMVSLTERFKALPIDTIERLEKTIDLVFEKAIEEQSFAPLYASLCSAMQTVQVSCGEGNKTTSFKKLIISKCQSLFELDKAQEMDSNKKLAEINSCKDPEKKKELQLEFEDNERRLRKRSVGNCRFIGELFKQKILTPNIMLYCIVNLVTKHVEEPLECLCNLLKTVGKELEQSFNLNDTFDKLKALTSKEMRSKIPSRIRFMIQDVIDLRRDKWVPRRVDSKPKLINEIENDAKNEAMEQSVALSSYRSDKQPRDHHRGDDNKFRGSDNKSRRNDNEWNVVQNTKYKQQNYTIDQSKLQGFKESSSVTTLGPSSKWSFSNSGGNKPTNSFTSSNTFAALNDDKKSSSASQMMSSKSTPRKPVVISESEERQRMMSGVASMMPQFAQTTQSLNSATSQISKDAVVESSVVELDPEVAEKINLQCKNIIQEYEQMHNLEDIIYSLKDDENSSIRTRHEEFVKSISLITLDSSSPNSRTEAGKLFAELLSKDVISMTAITSGIDAVLKDWNDYLMDYPQFFSYIAAIIAPLLISKTAPFEFNNLKDACTSIRPDNSSVFFTEVLQKILSSKETQNIKELGGILWIYNKWRSSEYISLDTFIPSNQLNKCFKNDRLGVFLLSVALYDKMRLTECKLLYDIIPSWISTNISAEIIKCPQFVRAFTIAIVIACLKADISYEDFFNDVHSKLLTFYIESEPHTKPEIQARQVQCLYGIQIMSAAEEHPGGMVLKLFQKLYHSSVISKEAFVLWKQEGGFKTGFDEDLETKTMAVVVLNSFFVSLEANESDDDDTAD